MGDAGEEVGESMVYVGWYSHDHRKYSKIDGWIEHRYLIDKLNERRVLVFRSDLVSCWVICD